LLFFWTVAGMILVGSLFALATQQPALAIMGALVPIVLIAVIRMQLDRQRRAFEDQVVDNLQVIASAMRSGHSFTGAIAVAVDDTAEPSKREFRRILTDDQIGKPVDESLRDVARRMHSEDFERVALVTTLQRDTGGNTAEVLDQLVETIRERNDLRRMVRSLTAQGRLARAVLTLLAPALLAVLILLNTDYVEALWQETVGIIALAIAGVMIGAGSYAIKRVVEIDV
jgi:tight adherence protein B